MNTRTAQLFTAALAALAAYGCGSSGSTSTNVTTPASARCDATVSSPASQFGSEGGTGTLAIGVARECSWRATSPVGWIIFTSAVEGQGDGSVSYRIAENPDPVNRQASLSVADRQVAIAQQPAPCAYSVSGPEAALGTTGGVASVEVRTHSACSWTAASEQPWATVSPSNGRGDGAIRVTVAPNTGAARQTNVIVGGERVGVRQNAFVAPPAPAPVPAPPAPPAPAPPAPAPPAPAPTPPAPAPPAPTPPAPTPPAPTPPAPTPPAPTPPAPTPPVPIREVELEGTVQNVSGSCGAATFRLGALVVYTTDNTQFERGPCRNLTNGRKVEVRGDLMSDGRVRADRIRFENDDDDDDGDDDDEGIQGASAGPLVSRLILGSR